MPFLQKEIVNALSHRDKAPRRGQIAGFQVIEFDSSRSVDALPSMAVPNDLMQSNQSRAIHQHGYFFPNMS